MENIHIPNLEKLKEKIKNFNKDNFHLVADFDRTLTKAFVDGRKMLSSYAYIREGGYLSPEYVKQAFALADYYRPIEFDPHIPQEEKIKKMVEWWSKHYELMIKSGMNTEVIQDIIKKNIIQLRDGSNEFFKMLYQNNIPCLIFSSGLGNLIQEFLKSKEKLTENVYFISNFLVFNKQGKAVSYTRPLIHTFNKKEVQIKDLPYQNKIIEKKNVILLGDVPGDADMCQGIDHDTTIKIGFLNENVDQLLKTYSQTYDVIILNDGPMDYVNSMLKQILIKKHQNKNF